MEDFKVSQSLLKAFTSYKSGEECGLVVKARYFDKVNFPPTEAQQLGCWFEYILTGSLPKNGEVPQAEYVNKGKDLAAKYRTMKIHADRFKKILDHYGFGIVGKGERLIIDDAEGTLDLRVVALRDIHVNDIFIPKGSAGIIDIKTTGLINDKWSPFGWDTERLPEKEGLMIQPVMYKYLAKKLFGKDHFFFFLIFSNTNEFDEKLILVDVAESKVEQMETIIRNSKKVILREYEDGFEAIPSIQRCKDCALKSTCSFFQDIPQAEVVHYG